MNKLFWASLAVTHIGKIRKTNQDAFINLADKQLWAVADGMGGHQSGEYASTLIIKALTKLQISKNIGTSVQQIHDELFKVNRELVKMASEFGPNAIIGSTVVILLASRKHCVCLWSGDSRIYLLRNGKLRQLTRDHNYESKLIAKGYSTEEIESQPFKHTLTHAIGTDIDLYLETQIQEIRPGDRFLLCSDGLTKEVPDEEIEFILNTNPLEQAMNQLLEQTLTAGARDNVTIVVTESSIFC
jgi:protein phosphatase